MADGRRGGRVRAEPREKAEPHKDGPAIGVVAPLAAPEITRPAGVPGQIADFLAAGPLGEDVASPLRASVARDTGRSVDMSRLHRGPLAGSLARAAGGRAITVGPHILADDTSDDVLRHELVHVAQNRGRMPALARLRLGNRSDPEETEAELTRGAVADADATVIRARSDMWDEYHSAEKRKERREAEERARQRIAQWEQVRDAQWQGDLASIPTSKEGATANTEALLLAYRVLGMKEAAEKKKLPATLVDAWAQASVAIELIKTALTAGTVGFDTATAAQPLIERFYWEFVSFLVSDDVMRKLSHQIKTALHTMIGKEYRAPPPIPMEPLARKYLASAQGPDVAGWEQVTLEFKAATRWLDERLKELLDDTSEARAGLEYAQDLLDRRSEVHLMAPNAVPLAAVFYPSPDIATYRNDKGETVQVAKAIPWQFYLDKIVKDDGSVEWILGDITSPKKWKVNRESTDTDSVDPPKELFEQLNSKLRFPVGKLYWKMPSGQAWSQVTTAPTTLGEWFTYIGLGLAALALIVGTAGAGSVVVGAIVVAGVGAGMTGTILDMQEKAKHGMLTDEDRAKGALFIAADIASILSLGLGKLAVAGAKAAQLTRLAAGLAQVGRVATVAAIALDTAKLVVISYDTAKAFIAIGEQPGLTDAQKNEARAKLVLQSLAVGVLTIVAIKSQVGDLRRGNVVLLETAPGAEPKVRPVEEPTVRNDPDLPSGRVTIDMVPGPGGTFRAGPVAVGPGANAADAAIHVGLKPLIDAYSGLAGFLRNAWREMRALLTTGRRAPPLQLEFEATKLQRVIAAREAEIASGVSPARQAELERELKLLQAAAEDVATRMKTPSLWDRGNTTVGTPVKPGVDYPDPPTGYKYDWSDVSKRWELAPTGAVPSGARLSVEYGANGKPTGQLSNQAALEATVVGRPLDEVTKQQLTAMGYKVEGSSVVPAVADPARQLQPLRVRPDGTLEVVPASDPSRIPYSAATAPVAATSIADARTAYKGSTSTDGVVYILRDADTGQILKVGKTEANNLTGRFGSYQTAADRLKAGMNVTVEVIPLQPGANATKVETSVRARLEAAGEALPWDNTGNRLGRPGPGSPFASIPRELRDHWQWDATGRLVPKGTAPPPAAKAPSVPTADELKELLTTYKGDVAAIATIKARSESTVYRWLKDANLKAEDFRPP